MATTTSVNGTDFILQIDSGAGYLTLGTSTSCSVSMSLETRDTSSKSSDGWAESLYGQRSWTMDVEALLTFNVANVMHLFDVYKNRTVCTVKFIQASTVTGDAFYSGTALLTSLSADAPMEDSMTYSASLQGSGVLTQTVN
tara:strand:- start:330 stop:752 length:423 start_codon:yes stop_codon:yes gene_type:complete